MSDPNHENLKRLSGMQQSEAKLHWQRNGFFLLSSSILLVALSQFQLPLVMISFGILGILMNIIWIFIQHRSSKYIEHWKKKYNELETKVENPPEIFSPKVKGIEMRKLAMALPFPFLMIWLAVFSQAIYDVYHNWASSASIETSG